MWDLRNHTCHINYLILDKPVVAYNKDIRSTLDIRGNADKSLARS